MENYSGFTKRCDNNTGSGGSKPLAPMTNKVKIPLALKLFKINI